MTDTKSPILQTKDPMKNQKKLDEEFNAILQENGWENVTNYELQTLLIQLVKAEKEGKEVIDFKGKPMLVKFGYILIDSLDEIRDGEN